jgi:hypothetical protein
VVVGERMIASVANAGPRQRIGACDGCGLDERSDARTARWADATRLVLGHPVVPPSGCAAVVEVIRQQSRSSKRPERRGAQVCLACRALRSRNRFGDHSDPHSIGRDLLDAHVELLLDAGEARCGESVSAVRGSQIDASGRTRSSRIVWF